MAIIVAGTVKLKPGSRHEFIEKSRAAMEQARSLDACEDFSVSPDPIDENRVNIFEKWSARAPLEAFRNSGPENDVFSLVVSFNIKEYEVNT